MRNMTSCATTTLVHRPKILPLGMTGGAEASSSEEEDDFTVVQMPMSNTPATPDEPMSSPEMVPASVVDIMATVRTDYASDDDWTML